MLLAFNRSPECAMLKWALFFLVISLVAALFGFTGISAVAADIARILFFIFIVICIILFVIAFAAGSTFSDSPHQGAAPRRPKSASPVPIPSTAAGARPAIRA